MAKRVWLLMLLGLQLAGYGFAQGVILPHPSPRHPIPRPPWPQPHPQPVPDRPLRLKSTQLDVTINDRVAETHVVQVFVNDFGFPLEGTYIFPVPPGAALKEFAIWENGKKLKGEVLPKEEARKIYLDILRKWRDPGLLEYMGDGTLQARIFPIPAHAEKKLELSYTQTLPRDNEFIRYFYPLRHGSSLCAEPPEVVSGSFDIRSSRDLKTVFAPSGGVDVTRKGERHAIAGFELKRPKELVDLTLLYSTSEEKIAVSVLTEKMDGEAGYFLMSVAPSFELDTPSIPKELVFVLDTSGSMREEGKMEKARAALRFGVRTLKPGDLFNIICFATSTRAFRERSVPAGEENVRAALGFVEQLEANGGTNFHDALRESLGGFAAEGARPRYLVVMTDGLPTVGETDPAKILRLVQNQSVPRLRLFTFGVGYDVNTFLLDRLAGSNQGVPAYVRPQEDLELAMSGFFNKISEPVLTDLKLEVTGVEPYDLYPPGLSDLFHGSEIMVLGRFRGAGKANVVLSGKVHGKTQTIQLPMQDFGASRPVAVLDRLWAQRKVAFLLDEIRLNGENRELKDEVIRLARRYGFVTPYTSYLAVDDDSMSPILPTVAGRDRAGAVAGTFHSVSETPTGKMAVDSAVTIQGMKESSELRNQETFRRIDGKDFVLEDGEWVDTDVKGAGKLPVKRLRVGSDEYIQVVMGDAVLARFFALGERVRVVWKGVVYQVEGE